MHKKLTITIDEKIYSKLHSTIGAGKISQFIEKLIEPHVIHADLTAAYHAMVADERREKEAFEWIEGVIGDVAHEAR